MAIVVTNNTGKDFRLPDRRLIPAGGSVTLSDHELEWIPLDKRGPGLLEVTALASPMVVSTGETLATRLDEVGGGVTYVGKAVVSDAGPGPSSTDPVWQVFRMTEVAGDLTIEYADGSKSFNQEWDSRAGLSYS